MATYAYATREDMGTVADCGMYYGEAGQYWLAMVIASDGISYKTCTTREEATDLAKRWVKVAPQHKWQAEWTVRELREVKL